MGNGACVVVHVVGVYGRSESYFGKDHTPERTICPLNKEEFNSGLLNDRDGYKFVFESSKYTFSKDELLLVKAIGMVACSAYLHQMLV